MLHDRLSARRLARLAPCVAVLAWALAAPAAASAATLRVCASGCTYSNLQSALNAAQPGDTILLRAGETFVGNFTLPAKSGTSFITIRSDAADASLPAAGVRLVPEGRSGANTARAALARIVGAGGTLKTTPVLRTAAGAHHYRLQFIEFDGTAQIGYETLIAIGTDTNDPAPPHDIVFDRVYIHGHPTKGQKRGVALNGGSTDILDSYIADIKAINADSVGIGGWNGAGPYRIVNNYIEAAGENVMFGGASPAIDNLIPSDIEISNNTIRKDPAWRNDILKAPGSFRVSAKGSGGSLASGTHYFKVVAVLPSGTREILSAPSAEVSASVSSSGSVTLAWSGTSGSEYYRIYRGTSAGGESVSMTTPSASTSFVYTGKGESSGKPSSKGSSWVAKNLIELKNAQRVTIDHNILENNWTGDQPGYALVFTPRNSAGTSPWVAVRDITLTNNVLRHSAAAINILGYDTTKSSGSAIADRLTFRNNLFYDIDPDRWGGGLAKCIQIGEGARHVVFDHNTFEHNTSAVLGPYGAPMPYFQFTNNLSIYGKYGVMGSGSSPGNPTIADYFPGAVFTNNVFAGGGKASIYPATTVFITMAEWDAAFADLAGEDYTILKSAVFYTARSGGSVPGADASKVAAGGSDSGGSTPPPSTSNPPVAVAGGPYTATTSADVRVDGSGSSGDAGITSYRWDWTDDILLTMSAVPDSALHGAWRKASVSGASTGIALVNPDASLAKVATAAASPGSYVDIRFQAAAGVPYYLWFRGRAENDNYDNDSFYAQFSDAVDALGRQVAPIGTTAALDMLLEEGRGAGVAGWGWNDSDWGGQADPIYFASSGEHVLRLQPREDGIQLDQIVLSSVAYASRRPGATRNDTSPVASSFGSASGVQATHRYALAAVYPIRLTVADAAGAQASDLTTVNVSGASGGGTGGGDSSPPVAIAGGPYSASTSSDLTVNGMASSAAAGIASYRWDWADEILLTMSAVPDGALHGAWRKAAVSGASTGIALVNPNANLAKVGTAAASPGSYVDIHFVAAAGVPYYLWFRGRAENDDYNNDSFYAQFSDAVDALGRQVAPIGTTDALDMLLEEGRGAGVAGWGWNDADWGGQADPIYFATSGEHVLRLQPREDGIQLDQIVLSSVAYAAQRPGATRNDTKTVASNFGTASGVQATHRYSLPAVYPLRLTVTDTAGAQASDLTTVNVSGASSSGLVADAGGPYQGSAGSAVSFDGSGSSGSIAAATWRTYDDIVLSGAALASAERHGAWTVVSDASAAGGTAIENPDAGKPKASTAASSPSSYVDVTFTAAADVPYRLWMRMRAGGDSYDNDSVFVQFSDAVTASGSATSRIGTTGALAIILEEGRGRGVSGWGWNDADYGSLAAPVYFSSSGPHTLRIQPREDGPRIDQIVLSTDDFYDARPGLTQGDHTIVPDDLDEETGLTGSHVWRHAGTYPLELEITDGAGGVSTALTSVVIR